MQQHFNIYRTIYNDINIFIFQTHFAVLCVNFVENIDISANSGIIKMNSCKHYTCFCNMTRRVYYET